LPEAYAVGVADFERLCRGASVAEVEHDDVVGEVFMWPFGVDPLGPYDVLIFDDRVCWSLCGAECW